MIKQVTCVRIQVTVPIDNNNRPIKEYDKISKCRNRKRNWKNELP